MCIFQTDFARLSRKHPGNTCNKRFRLRIIFTLAFLWSSLVVWRLYELQIANVDTWEEWALKQHLDEIEVASERGPILDRNGKLLAVSVPAGSIYVRPKKATERERIFKELAPRLNMKKQEIESILSSKSPFVWIKRQVPRALAEEIGELKIKGVDYLLEARRYYPYNHAASTLMGKVGIDGRGLSGLEALYEKKLHKEDLKRRVSRDALGNVIHVLGDEDSTFEPPKGDALSLTLDADLQLIVDEELEKGRVDAVAKRAYAVLVDSESGDILALSQAPSANLNIEKLRSKSDLKNFIFETVIEPGSIMKPIIAGAAIDLGLSRPTDMINCEGGRFPFSTHVIKDVHAQGTISLRDVIVRSSNIGITKVGLKLGKERLFGVLQRFGFGEYSGLQFPGETRGILRDVESWAPVDVATHSFGQGIAVTPLQIVRAVSAIANGGTLPDLSLFSDSSTSEDNPRVLSENAASLTREMMYGVVEDSHGTGKQAAIEGLRVGGKTGTAQKARAQGRGYEPGAYVSSFVGFVDGTPVGVSKTYTLLVMVDEPKGGVIYGGALAAPVFKRIMVRALKFLSTQRQLQPDLVPSAPKLHSIQFSG